MPRRIYGASSWRNTEQPAVVALLRGAGHRVYDFRNPREGDHGFSWSEIDPTWQGWSPSLLRQALTHPAARRGCANDFDGMRWADTGVLLLPCGRSAHLEAGWFTGSGRELFVLMCQPEVPELMYRMATAICVSVEELLERLDVPAERSAEHSAAGTMGDDVRRLAAAREIPGRKSTSGLVAK